MEEKEMSLLNNAVQRTGRFSGRIIGFREVEVGLNKKEAIELTMSDGNVYNVFYTSVLNNLATYVDGNTLGEVLANVRDNKIEVKYVVTDYCDGETDNVYYNIKFAPKSAGTGVKGRNGVEFGTDQATEEFHMELQEFTPAGMMG